MSQPTPTTALSGPAEPPFVRAGSAQVKDAWREGVAFEALLLGQLGEALFAVGGFAGEAEEGSEASGEAAAGDPLLAALGPQALAVPLAARAPLGVATLLAERATAQAGQQGAGRGR